MDLPLNIKTIGNQIENLKNMRSELQKKEKQKILG
jgi:hypothetical protein